MRPRRECSVAAQVSYNTAANCVSKAGVPGFAHWGFIARNMGNIFEFRASGLGFNTYGREYGISYRV